MRVFVFSFFALLFLLIVSISALGTGSYFTAENNVAVSKDAWPHHLRVLIGANGGQWSMMGEPIVEALSGRVLPTSSRIGNAVSNIKEVNFKDADLAFTLRCFLEVANSEEAEYQDIALDNTVLMANMYPQVLYFLVRKDFAVKNNITNVESLLQKKMPLRFGALKPGTSSEFVLSLLLKYGYNTNLKQLGAEQGWSISYNNYKEAADKFVAGEIDCFVCTAGIKEPLILEVEKYTSVSILPLDQEVLDLLSEKFKTTTHVIEPGVYASIDKPVKVLADRTCLMVRKDFPDDLVFEITKALWENKDKISLTINDFSTLEPENALDNDSPMHPGAIKFWSSPYATHSASR